MSLVIALGIFLFGAGVGSLTSAMVRGRQMRKLKGLQKTAGQDNPEAEKQGPRSEERKSA